MLEKTTLALTAALAELRRLHGDTQIIACVEDAKTELLEVGDLQRALDFGSLMAAELGGALDDLSRQPWQHISGTGSISCSHPEPVTVSAKQSQPHDGDGWCQHLPNGRATPYVFNAALNQWEIAADHQPRVLHPGFPGGLAQP